MKEVIFTGTAGEVGRFSRSIGNSEWKIEVSDETDDVDYSYFGTELTIGDRWGDHEYIDFSFSPEDVASAPEKYNQLKELYIQFFNFKESVNQAYNLFEAAARKVLDAPFGEE